MRSGVLIWALATASLMAGTASAQSSPPPEAEAAPDYGTSPTWGDAPAPPAKLLPFLKDGMPDPESPGWMRGAFEDASPVEKADWEALKAWRRTCWDAGHTKARAALKAMGEDAPGIAEMGFPPPLCDALSMLEPFDSMRKDWPDYLAANKEANRIHDIYFFGAQNGLGAVSLDPDFMTEDTETLLDAKWRDQVYRGAIVWASQDPKLDPLVEHVLMRRFSVEIVKEDRKNTAMLKQWVATRGWPGIKEVGKIPSNAAWLLVQHADHDPAFQLKALQLMEPLVASGDVDKKNYAYLYDRIHLKLNGKQRYGTQMTCEKGKRISRPLEDAARVDTLRAEVGLNSVAEYIDDTDKHFPPCSKDDT